MQSLQRFDENLDIYYSLWRFLVEFQENSKNSGCYELNQFGYFVIIQTKTTYNKLNEWLTINFDILLILCSTQT